MRRVFSCLVDGNRKYIVQSCIWVNCLILLQNIFPGDIYVHTVEVKDRLYFDWLLHKGVNIVPVKVISHTDRFCNKLAQLDTFIDTKFSHDQVVLMDCDTAWIGEKTLPTAKRTISARIAGLALPPEQVFTEIFALAGLGQPMWVVPAILSEKEKTDINNVNGGVYLINGAFINWLRDEWKNNLDWLFRRSYLLKSPHWHADQISLAMALRKLHTVVEPLGVEWNYSVLAPSWAGNVEFRDFTRGEEVQILHYHNQLDVLHLSLTKVGIETVDMFIMSVNMFIDAWCDEDSYLRSLRK